MVDLDRGEGVCLVFFLHFLRLWGLLLSLSFLAEHLFLRASLIASACRGYRERRSDSLSRNLFPPEGGVCTGADLRGAGRETKLWKCHELQLGILDCSSKD